MPQPTHAVARMFKAIETGDTHDADTYISHDYSNRESLDDGRSDKHGPAEFLETAEWLRAAFSDLRFDNVDVISCDDRVVVLTYMSGTHTGPFMGLPPTHRPFRQRQVHLFRLDKDQKVREHLAQRDDLGLRRQLTS
jgi:predicted ester cyclase